ncbi:MAG: hypothetical protein J7J38_01115 [Candidatus Aenigmarchaeota archaeon]|nr:hypothetical protein [Candidatus Aenigmarchaeota archaeon]
MRTRKGYLYTLEVLLAASMIFAAIIFTFRYAPIKPQTEMSIIKQQGFDALKYIDEKGDLRKYVSLDDETGIENDLSDILIKSIKFEIDICDNVCDQRNVPTNQPIIIVDYYISGYDSDYGYNKVRLYMWKKY